MYARLFWRRLCFFLSTRLFETGATMVNYFFGIFDFSQSSNRQTKARLARHESKIP
jgi:hypothetical protein